MKARHAISMAAACAAIALFTGPAHAYEPERVDIVFAHAMPNIPGKSLIAAVPTQGSSP